MDGWVEVYRSGGGGGVVIWRRRCISYAQPLGFYVLCLGGKYVRGPRERERGKGREGGREFRGMMDGGKYERERKVMERRSSLDFFRLLLLSFCSSRVYQLIATYIVC